MSYFAVLHAEPRKITVTHCHVNIWVPSARWKPRCVVDIGLGLRSSGEAIDDGELQVALPFDASECEDIEALLHDVSTAALVFGENVGITRQEKGSKLEGPTVNFLLSSCDRQRDPALDRPGGCVWTIKPHVPIGSTTSTYVRVRFCIPFRKLWKPDRSGGGLLDFRIADTREAISHEKWKGLSNFVPIKMLNIFVIAPSFWSAAVHSPAFSNVRTLEHMVWRKYLAEYSASFGGHMLVRHWKEKAGDDPIGSTRPFAAFLQLRESERDQLAGAGRRLIFWASIVYLAVVTWGESLMGGVLASWTNASGFLEKSGVTLTVGGILAVIHYGISGIRNLEWAKDRVLGLFRKKA